MSPLQRLYGSLHDVFLLFSLFWVNLPLSVWLIGGVVRLIGWVVRTIGWVLSGGQTLWFTMVGFATVGFAVAQFAITVVGVVGLSFWLVRAYLQSVFDMNRGVVH
jgi:hypothetical protein